jgi:hypothetical protein
METVNEVDDSPKSTTDNVRLGSADEQLLRLKMSADESDESGSNSASLSSGSAAALPPVGRARGVRRLKSASLTSAGTVKRSGSFQAPSPSSQIQRLSGGSGPSNPRVPERARSLRCNELRPMAPTKSNDVAASLRGSGVSRNRVLMRASSSSANGMARSRIAPPTRGLSATSSSGGLRPYTRDQIVNTQIERRINNRIPGPGGTLQRTVSDCSNSNGSFDDTMHSMVSGGDFSLFTMDSIHLRKGQQVIADPLDDKTYLYGSNEDDCSFADHETYVTRMSGDDFDLYEMSAVNRENAVLTFGTEADSNRFTERLHKMGITENIADDQSMASGLTNDFTDFGLDDDDYEDDACYEEECTETHLGEHEDVSAEDDDE